MKKKDEFIQRTYRTELASREWASYEVRVKETDLLIRSSSLEKERALNTVHSLRKGLEDYIHAHPRFRETLVPWPEDPFAPSLVKDMIMAGTIAGVGPMAAVAGAIAQRVGEMLLPRCSEVIVENGGDIYLKTERPVLVGIFAGTSLVSGKLAVRIQPAQTPLGICTSSATVGPSKSFGKADAVTILAKSAALADALATSLANQVKSPADIPAVLEKAKEFTGLSGIVIVVKDQLGAWGEIELAPLGLEF